MPLETVLPLPKWSLCVPLSLPSQGVNKSEKRMKLTLKGGAAVDPDSGE